MNPKVDQYLIDGCMRCDFGATPRCKVHRWREELDMLRQIVLASGLTEEIKWGVPVYTLNGKNVVNIGALRETCTIGFFKGALMSDPHGLLMRQANIQQSRVIFFTSVDEIVRVKDKLADTIREAIEVENSGVKFVPVINPEPIPDELLQAFEEDPVFERAFYALTPGRQRGYIIHISSSPRVQTRLERIEKSKLPIFNGIGIHDKYHS